VPATGRLENHISNTPIWSIPYFIAWAVRGQSKRDRHIDVYGFFGSNAQAQFYGAKIHTIKQVINFEISEGKV
jgi:hypothetical protein